MHLLLIGGTRFLGRALVEAALARGCRVTVFHRGQTPMPPVAAPVEELLGDRDGGLAALEDRRFDAVVDTCGYVPRLVRDSARLLAGRCGHYTFISSLSVYAQAAVGQDEAAPLATIDDPATERVDGTTYGPLKALCEAAAEEAMPGRVLHVRAGLLIGPHDPTDRFTYWIRRGSAAEPFLAPAPPEAPLQLIDVRDVAAWVIAAAAREVTGAFNIAAPPATWGEALSRCASLSAAHVRWAPEAWLGAQQVRPWTDLPLWIPQPEGAAFWSRPVEKALGEGLRIRPLAESIRAIADWDRARGTPPLKAGMPRERERALLAALDG